MIAIIDYGAGNIGSIKNALLKLGCDVKVTNSSDEILRSDKVVFPGVGEASTAMLNLKSNALDKLLPNLKQPTLGICLGMQLMCLDTEENDTKGLAIFKTSVKQFPKIGKVPHVGWNSFKSMEGNMYNNLNLIDDVYYVHSYYAEICECTNASCEYLIQFSASLNYNNFYGVQFHPEKSGLVGAKILENFLQL